MKKPTNPSPDFRRNVVNGTLKHFAAKHAAAPEHIVVAKAKSLSKQITDLTNDVLKADVGKYNEHAMTQLVEKLYMEGFNTFSKEELVFITTLLHTDLVIEKIKERVAMGLENPENEKEI